MQGQKLKELRFKNNLSQEALGLLLGCTKQHVSKLENEKAKLTQKNIFLLKEKFNFSLENNRNEDEDCTIVEHIGIRPACGAGTYVEAEPEIKPIKLSNSLITNFLRCSSAANLKTFTASGDSMEDTIYDGDLLLVDVGRNDLCNSGIYIYSVGSDWRCKRLNLKMDGTLEIISDNLKYEREYLKSEDNVELIVRGRVIKNLSRGL